MNETHESGSGLRPTHQFMQVETMVVDIRREIANLRCSTKERTAQLEDVLRLCALLERLARRGKWAGAEEAIQLADYVETLVSVLGEELNALIVSETREMAE